MRTYKAHCIYGYYVKDVKVTVDEKFPEHEGAQCGIIYNSNGINLMSYESLICTIDKNRFLSFSLNPSYSRTTTTHVTWFLKKFAPNISLNTCKICYNQDMQVNVDTGEIKPLFENADLQLNDYDFEERY